MIIALSAFFLISLAAGMVIYDRTKGYGRLEALLMAVICGACAFPLAGILLSSVSMLYLTLVYSLAFISVIAYAYNDKWKIVLGKIPISNGELLVLFMAIFMFGAFYYGGTSMPWLEDGDPNGHAVSASYIANYHTYSKPSDMFVARYLEPYPVGYQLWMGLLAQDGLDVNQTLKVFNYLLICLGLVAFFYFVKVLTGDSRIAVASSFILFALPTFSSRFIFSQAFAVTQIIAIMYLIACAINRDKKFYAYAGVLLGALFLTQPTASAIMGGFLAIWIVVEYLSGGELNKGFTTVIIIGLLIGAAWWILEFQKYGVDKVKEQLNLNVLGKGMAGFADPAKRYYGIGDFIVSPMANTTDNLTGIGLGIFALMLLGAVMFLNERKDWQILAVLWLAFGILGVFSDYLPITLVPSRFWVFMSIPLAIVAGAAFSTLTNHRTDIALVGFVAIVAVLVFSFYPKYIVNTTTWSSARFFTPGDYAMVGYVMNHTSPGEKAFDSCMYERVWTMNLWDDPLDREALLFKNNAVNTSKFGWDSEGWLKLARYNQSGIFRENVIYIHDFLQAKGYKYLFVNSRCVYNGVPQGVYDNRIREFDSSGEFDVLFKYDSERVYTIK